MENTNFDAPTFYNEDDPNHNNGKGLDPDTERLLTRLIALRGFRQLKEAQADGTPPEDAVSDWEQMPRVAKDYQSTIGRDSAKVADLPDADVIASGEGDDPVISFEEKAEPKGDDSKLDDIDEVSFW